VSQGCQRGLMVQEVQSATNVYNSQVCVIWRILQTRNGGATLGDTVLSFVPVFVSKEYTPVRSVAASKLGGRNGVRPSDMIRADIGPCVYFLRDATTRRPICTYSGDYPRSRVLAIQDLA